MFDGGRPMPKCASCWNGYRTMNSAFQKIGR